MAIKRTRNGYIYPAVFSYGKGGYTVTFPDLPGCITQGANVREALAMAKEAMELYIFCLEEDNQKIPPPCAHPEKLKLPPRSFTSMIEIWMPQVREEMKREEKNNKSEQPESKPAIDKHTAEYRLKASIDEASRLEDARRQGYVQGYAKTQAAEYEGRENYAEKYAEAYVLAYWKVNVKPGESGPVVLDMARDMLQSGIDAKLVAKYCGISEDTARSL